MMWPPGAPNLWSHVHISGVALMVAGDWIAVRLGIILADQAKGVEPWGAPIVLEEPFLAFRTSMQFDAVFGLLDAAKAGVLAAHTDADGASVASGSNKALALGCSSSSECASGFCADGVCCDSACGQPCYTCHTTGSYGTCLPQITGDDSTATPACAGAKTCGLNPTPANGGFSVCGLKDKQACTSNSACASNTCVIYYVDADGDGWGNTADPIRICNEPNAAAPPGFSTRSGDCCDTDASAHPGATSYSPTPDLRGSFDINCDGTIEIQPGCAGEWS